LGVASFVEIGVQLPEGFLDFGQLGANVLPCLLEDLLGLSEIGVFRLPEL